MDYGTDETVQSGDSPPESPATGSNSINVTGYGYDGLGRQDAVTDNADRTTKTFYNSLGQKAYVVATWTDFLPGNESGACGGTRHDQDVVTEYTYNDAGQVKEEIAWNRDASGSLTKQKTTYLYASDIPDNANHAGLKYGGADYRNVLRAVVYPDGPDASAVLAAFEEGDLGDHDFVEYTYYLDGSVATMTDQRGVVHTYQYDVDGRQVSDAVTTLPDGVDGAVRRIERGYDMYGGLQRVTSYSSPSGGTAASEVWYDYDAWGNVAAIWQSHDGNVSKAAGQASLKVSFGYDDTSGVPRLSTVTYAGGRVVHYGYADCADGALGRPTSLGDGGPTPYATFSYLGASQIVGESRPAVGLSYSLMWEGSLDVLGRVTELYWTLGINIIDDFCYGYDASGNRTWRLEDTGGTPEIYDEAYTYDGLNRLTGTNRGALDWDTGTITDLTSSQSWTLDALGNWGAFTTDGTTQTRTATAANEIDTISSGVKPLYDAAGNMTVAPKPGAESTTGFALTYDAWNRLVKVQQWTDANGNHLRDTGETLSLVATYRYDGLGQRITKTLVEGTRFDYYYNDQWQVLEVRKNGSAYEQYLCDPAYIDTPVMRWRNADGNASNGLEEVVYYTFDANHNVTALVGMVDTDADPETAPVPEVVERYVYTSYGAPTFLKADWSPQVVSGHADGTASLFDNVQLFAGYPVDPETGFGYSRVRYDDFGLAWLSRDPALTDSNLYQYCGDRPTVATDPTGLLPQGAHRSGASTCMDCHNSGVVPQEHFIRAVSGLSRIVPETYQALDSTARFYLEGINYVLDGGITLAGIYAPALLGGKPNYSLLADFDSREANNFASRVMEGVDRSFNADAARFKDVASSRGALAATGDLWNRGCIQLPFVGAFYGAALNWDWTPATTERVFLEGGTLALTAYAGTAVSAAGRMTVAGGLDASGGLLMPRSRSLRFGRAGVSVEPLVVTRESASLAYTTKIRWGILDIDVRPARPGFWGRRIPQGNARVEAYELKINSNNESFYLPHPQGGYVQFENLVGNTLQDGKLIMNLDSSIYRVNNAPPFAREVVLSEAIRQSMAASYYGMTVEWLVSDVETIDQLRSLLGSSGVPVKLTYLPE